MLNESLVGSFIFIYIFYLSGMRDSHFNFLLWRHPQVRFCFLLSFVDCDKKGWPRENVIKGLTYKFALKKAEAEVVKIWNGNILVHHAASRIASTSNIDLLSS